MSIILLTISRVTFNKFSSVIAVDCTNSFKFIRRALKHTALPDGILFGGVAKIPISNHSFSYVSVKFNCVRSFTFI